MIQVMTCAHPVELVHATHADIRRHARILEQLAAHVASRGCDPEARDVAAIVLRFFEAAGGAHHRQEEVELFIAVEAHVPSAELNATRALLHRLRRDHEGIASTWARLRPDLEALAAGATAPLDAEAARQFAAIQAAHIEREEAELMPLARRVLPARTLARLGESMAKRRQPLARSPA